MSLPETFRNDTIHKENQTNIAKISYRDFFKDPILVGLIDKAMIQNNDLQVKELSFLLDTPIDLALKFVVHYGKFSQYKIKNFRKLYGKTVIEAHQMLKNKRISQICYIYYSHAFLDFKSVDNIKECQKITKTAFGEYYLL